MWNMIVPSMLFPAKIGNFVRPLLFFIHNSKTVRLSTLEKYRRNLFCSIPPKILAFGQIDFNRRCRTSLKWGINGALSRKLSNQSSTDNEQDCKDEQSVKRLTLKQRTSFKETKRKVTQKIEELNENVLTIPNALCVMRIAVAPVLGYLVLQEFYMTSLGIFVFAGFTDVIDGYIARTFPSQQSMIGSFLDPAADKLLIATLFLTLTAKGLIPIPLTSLIILRDICLMTAGFYIRYVSLPPPKTLSRYFDVSFATARLSPTTISKVNTLIQLSLVAFSLAAPVFGYTEHLFLQILWYITGATTVVSAGSYIYYKNTYKVLMSRSETKSRVTKES